MSFVVKAQDFKDSLTIHFDFNKYTLTETENQKLIEFSDFVFSKNKTIIKIIIEAYCDSIGSFESNKTLSLNRCKTVNSYFENRKVQIKITPKGETKFISENKTEVGRALNRRAKISTLYTLKDTIKVSEDSLKTEITKQFSKGKISGVAIEKGKNIIVKNMNFVGGMHTLVPSGKFATQKLLQTMKDNPTLKIEIQGHICCGKPNEDGLDFETNEYKLSENRAKAVYNYLVENGIDASRMTYIGKKGEFPIVTPEITEADRNKNRRVEVKIIDF
jgi:outer membrane protein OmpA-like peptidoglycan-associated protein